MSLAAHLAARSEPPVYVTVDAASHQDLDALIAYPSITTIHLQGATKQLDLTPLAQLPALDYLSFTEPRPDLSIIPALKGLRGLHLGGCKQAELAQLAGASITMLTAPKAAPDLAPLAALPHLRQLTLLGDPAPLRGLSLALDSLSLYGKLAELDPVLGLTALRELHLGAFISASSAPLKALKALAHLTRLRLPESKLTELDALAELTQLVALDLTGCKKLGALHGLRALHQLEELKLQSCPIKALDPLAGLTAMKELWLSSTKITSLKPLAAMCDLTVLLAGFTPLATLEGVEALRALETLDIGQSKVRDLTPLKGLARLSSLSAYGLAPLRGAEILATLPALQHLQIGGSDVDPALIPAHLNP
jgi:internalin A